MGVNLSGVNLDNVEANAALDAIPAGWYNAQIVGSEMKPSGPNAKDPNGQYLELTMQILDGEYAGRKLFDRLNLVNSNPNATEIAYKTLKAIYNAIGVARVQSSDELHGKPLKVKVKVKPATTEYGAANEVQGYDNVQSNHTPAGVTAGGVAGAPSGAPPWVAGGAPGNAAPAAGPSPVAGSPAPGSAPVVGGAGGWQPPGAQSQPWAQPAQQAAPPAQVDPMSNARADGWQAHPQHPGYSWRGNDVVSDAELQAHYPVQPAAPAAPSGPPAFQPPQQQAPAQAAPQAAPWQAGAPAAGGAPAFGGGAPGGPAPATSQPGAPTPPWARG